MFHSFEMVYQFGDIKESFKYENRNSLSKYYYRNDLINITFNFYSNVIDMSFNYYIKMPKSMLETTLIIYYIADLPVTRLWLLTNKSINIAVPYASLRSLILLLSSIELRLFFSNT